MEIKERWKKKPDYFRLVGGGFNKKGNLHMTHVLGNHKVNRSLHLPDRNLKVYIKTLIGFSHIFSPDSLNNTLFSQGYILETAPSVGMDGRTDIPKMGRGEDPPIASSSLNWWSHPLSAPL